MGSHLRRKRESLEKESRVIGRSINHGNQTIKETIKKRRVRRMINRKPLIEWLSVFFARFLRASPTCMVRIPGVYALVT